MASSPANEEYLQLDFRADIFLLATGIETIIYASLVVYTLYKTKNQLDSFSKRITYTFLLGFLVKILMWSIYAVLVDNLLVTSGSSYTDNDHLLKIYELCIS